MSDLMFQASIMVPTLHYTMLVHTFLSFTCHHLSTQYMLDQWDHQFMLPHHPLSIINLQLFTINLTLLDMLLIMILDTMLELLVIMEVTMDLATDGEATVDTEDSVVTVDTEDLVVMDMVDMADMAMASVVLEEPVMVMVLAMVVVTAWVATMVNAVTQVMDLRELSNKNDPSKLKAVVPSSFQPMKKRLPSFWLTS